MANLMDFKIEILKKEIDVLSQKINHFDDLRHQTKQMAITLLVAAVGLGITSKSPLVLILAALIPFPFWFLDSTHHAYQEGFHARLQAIRNFIRDKEYFVQYAQDKVSLADCFASDDFGIFPVPDFYGDYTFLKKDRKQNTNVWNNFKKGKMVLFYLPLSITALLFAIFLFYGVLKIQ
jgi:hypothetical protein